MIKPFFSKIRTFVRKVYSSVKEKNADNQISLVQTETVSCAETAGGPLADVQSR